MRTLVDILVELVVRVIMMIIRAFPGNVMLIRTVTESYYKVNRCLARYSPRATTTNRPTNRAPKKPAWPGPN